MNKLQRREWISSGVFGVVCAMTIASCSQPGGAPSGAGAQSARQAQTVAPTHERGSKLASVPFDVAQIQQRAHFAYEVAGSGFRAGHSTYHIDAQGDGTWTMRPMRYPDAGQTNNKTAKTRVPGQHVSALGIKRPGAHVDGAPVSFATASIAGAAETAVTRIAGDGSLTIARGAATETLRNTKDGVEQSWSFARRPAGTTDLVVRVAVQGQDYTGTSDGGLHFADATNGVGLRYGVATWIDANGQRTQVRPRFHGGQIVLAVPASVVAASAFPAVLDPVVSPEFGTDAPVVQPAVSERNSPRIVWDGTDYMAVWIDTREDLGVYGARIQTNGTVRDATGFFVAHHTNDFDDAPGIACSGTGTCLAVWTVSAGNEGPGNIHARLINTATGALVGASDILVSNNETAEGPSVAWNGTRYLVAWTDSRNDTFNTDIYGGLVDVSGNVLSDPTANIAISTAPTKFQEAPTVSSDGTNFLVVWSDNRVGGPVVQLYGRLLNNAGVDQVGEIAVHAPLNSGEDYEPESVYAGGNYLVVWNNDASAAPQSYGVLVTAAGAPGAAIHISSGVDIDGIPGSPATQAAPFVASNGSNFLVTWQDARSNTGSDIYGQRVTFAGALLGSEIAIAPTSPNDAASAAIASNGTDYAVAYSVTEDNLLNTDEINAVGVLASGAAGFAAEIISDAGNTQISPGIAYDGTNYLLAWPDNRNSFSLFDLYGAIVSPSGALVDGVFAISTTGSSAGFSKGSASVAFNGTNYLVAYSERHLGFLEQIMAARVNTNGAVPTTDQLVSSLVAGGGDGVFEPVVASDGARFLVAYAADSGVVLAALVGANANLVTGDIPLDSEAIPQGDPSIAYDGAANYLIAWDAVPGADLDIQAARVRASDGTVLDATPITVASGANAQSNPSVDFDGANFVIAYSNAQSGTPDIWATRLSPAGAVLNVGGVRVSPLGGANRNYPRVAFDGTDDVFAWTESGTDNLYAARTSPDLATIIDTTPLLVTAAGTSLPFAMATNRQGVTMVGYSRFVIGGNNDALRVRGVTITNLPDALSCGAGGNNACASGFCSADDHCCNVACANPPNGVSACTTGTCSPLASCNAGFFNCDGSAANGCEVTQGINNCGGCGAAGAVPNTNFECSSNHIAAPTCSAGGVCNGACSTGFADCNGSKTVAGNGCETATTVQGNCGACGVTCPSTTCTQGLCGIVAGNGACTSINTSACGNPACQQVIAGCPATDTDGDGLADIWETNGYIDINCNGVNDAGDVALPGANPSVPDIYVVYDWMNLPSTGEACTTTAQCQGLAPANTHIDEQCVGNVCTGHTHDPEALAPGSIELVVARFAARGFNLHVTRGVARPHSRVTAFDHPMATCEGATIPAGTVGGYAVDFYDIKNLAPAAVTASTRLIYHYGLFAHYSSCDSIADCGACPVPLNMNMTPKTAPPAFGQTGIAEISGNDFIVSLGNLINDLGAIPNQFNVGGTFMHELGHNLGLRHGGGSEDTPIYKPNYLSVMNYRYQTSGIQAADVIGSAVPDTTLTRLDYSTQVLPTFAGGVLNEANLSDPAGFGSGRADLFTYTDGQCGFDVAATNGPVDWGGDGSTAETGVAADLNPQDHPMEDFCGEIENEVLNGHADWGPAMGQSVFTYNFQCTPFYADGAGPLDGYSINELTGAQAIASHTLYQPIPVTVEVRPGACSNPWITLGSSSQVPVAVLGSMTLDVSQIDVTTLRVSGAPALSTSISDVNNDGIPDLTGEYVMSKIALTASSTMIHFSGALKNSQSIFGTAAVVVLQSSSYNSKTGQCTGTISDMTLNGNVTVPAGATCTLVDVIVSGNLTAGANSTLILQGGTVRGNIQTNGSTTFTLGANACSAGTTVNGNVQAQDTATTSLSGAAISGNVQAQQGGAVNITGCSVRGNVQVQQNTVNQNMGGSSGNSGGTVSVGSTVISGNLQVQNNHAVVGVTSNTVSGNLQIQSNTGGTTVTGNTVHGNLQCQGDVPVATGQCGG